MYDQSIETSWFTCAVKCSLPFLVAIQCLESAYSIDTQDESHIAKYQVQRNLLDIFNSQISSEVSQCLE